MIAAGGKVEGTWKQLFIRRWDQARLYQVHTRWMHVSVDAAMHLGLNATSCDSFDHVALSIDMLNYWARCASAE